MRIPLNLITKNQYTTGKEFVYFDTYEDYQGYYYTLNNKFFAGKEFKTNSRELIQISSSKVNKLKLNNITSMFAGLSKIELPNNKLSSFIYQPLYDQSFDPSLISEVRFFAKKLNNNPILIKEIDEDTFNKVKSDPIYQTIFIGVYQGKTINSSQAYVQMTGLKEFVEG